MIEALGIRRDEDNDRHCHVPRGKDDLPIIVCATISAVRIRATRAAVDIGLRAVRRWCCGLCWQTQLVLSAIIVDTAEQQQHHARWEHHLWLPVAGGVGGGRDGGSPRALARHRSHHRRGVVQLAASCCTAVGWPTSKLKGARADCSC